MNWKQEAVDKLRRFDAMRLSVKNIPAEIQRLELEAKAIRSSRTDGVRVRTTANAEDNLLSNLVKRQELQQSFEQADLWLQTVCRGLSSLNPEEKLILQRLYICPEKGGVDRLCQDLGVEQSTVYRKRDQALQRFTLSMYGSLES